MTKKEYTDQLGLNEDQAKKHLKVVRVLFPAFILIILCQYAPLFGRELLPAYWLLYAAALATWIIYCAIVLRATKRSVLNVLWGLLIFPFGVILFYPYLVKPLKIVLGEIPPPEKIPTNEERRVANKKAWKNVLTNIGWICLACFSLVAVLIVVLLLQGNGTS
jgi:hypothetical protein